MIIANITTWRGQDVLALHFYCTHMEVPDTFPSKQYLGHSFYPGKLDKDSLQREVTEPQAVEINKQCGYRAIHSDLITDKFDSVEQIHDELKKQYPNQIIVTYFENELFKEMLYFKDGENLGYKAFGEVWNNCPTSCWTDLLPEDKSTIKIKCDDCGKEYTLDQVSYEREMNDNYNDGKLRKLTQFYKKRDFEIETGEDICCRYFNLMWNVVL